MSRRHQTVSSKLMFQSYSSGQIRYAGMVTEDDRYVLSILFEEPCHTRDESGQRYIGSRRARRCSK